MMTTRMSKTYINKRNDCDDDDDDDDDNAKMILMTVSESK